MSGKRIEVAFEAFCREHRVTLQCYDDLKNRRVVVIMRKEKQTATRYLDYEEVMCLLPSPFLRGMYDELADEAGLPGLQGVHGLEL